MEWVHARDYTPFSDVLWDYVRRTADDARKTRKLKGLTSESELRDRLFDIQRRANGDLSDREAKVAANNTERTGLDSAGQRPKPGRGHLTVVGDVSDPADTDVLDDDTGTPGDGYEAGYDTSAEEDDDDDDVNEAGIYDTGANW